MSDDDADDDMQVCGKCCTNDKCNNFVLYGWSESGATNLLASLTLLVVMAAVAMTM